MSNLAPGCLVRKHWPFLKSTGKVCEQKGTTNHLSFRLQLVVSHLPPGNAHVSEPHPANPFLPKGSE